MRRFGVLYADPPWTFATRSAKGRGRSADNHYPVMSLAEIKAFTLPPMADDSVLFLWTTDPLLPQALEVMAAWGFAYKTVAFVWVKTRDSRILRDHFPMGLGYWTRANPEICLLGTRGKPKRRDKDVPKLVFAHRGRHSEKPVEVNRRIRRLVRGPYIELFARSRVPGWAAQGNEL
jgi:N6-adenosine-specific RNA methylase IME4